MRALLACGLLSVAGIASAQQVATSARPDAVSVTVYRDLGRGSEPLRLDWLNGYALISETRRVRLTSGENVLRFEGVASGIIPQSAILSGLPDGVIERNRDAFLLSPGTLLNQSLGRRVHLRRTNRASGKVVEQDAVVRSGADGAVVLQTPAGFEALRCTGGAETIVYPEVPAGLSAKPTLSLRVRSATTIDAAVTLSYLAGGFDWQANYIVQLARDGRRADLFAWLTLASTDDTSFVDAGTNVVAGRLNREDAPVQPVVSRPVSLDCWPNSTTSDVPTIAPPPPPPPPPAALMAPPPPQPERGGEEEIVVTASRIMAEREQLGDIKLYRVPEPVTVAANSQKQVALLERPGVALSFAYRNRIAAANEGLDQAATRTLVMRNRAADGLGVPLPAGQVAVFTAAKPRPLLLGEGRVGDYAVGEDVEVPLEEAPGVRVRLTRQPGGRYQLAVSNARSEAITYEAELLVGDNRVLTPSGRLGRRNGRPLWVTDVPANGSRTLTYRLSD